MKKVLLIMGSDSDYPVLKNTISVLQEFGINYDAVVCSAHRTPDKAAQLAIDSYKNGYGVIIAAAGLAAHLPGVIASYTILPVIGLPIASGPLNGKDAMYSILQMPSGVPVATVAINGAQNAGLLAVQILSVENDNLTKKLLDYKLKLSKSVEKKNIALQEKLAKLNQ